MKHTKNETEVQTLTRLLAAMAARHPVTLTYLKEERDENDRRTGRLIETVRTIEIYDAITTEDGHILIKAMDRASGKSKCRRLDRITAYTIHRTAYVVPRPADATPAPVFTAEHEIIAREWAREDREYWLDKYTAPAPPADYEIIRLAPDAMFAFRVVCKGHEACRKLGMGWPVDTADELPIALAALDKHRAEMPFWIALDA